MDASEKRRLAVAVGMLGEAFRQTITKQTISAYELALSDLPIDRLEQAVSRAMRERKFMPTPFEIRELCGHLMPSARAVLAWSALDKAIHRIGIYGSPDFDDRVINAAVRNLGGWVRVCELPNEEREKWFRREFERVYLTLCETGISAEAAAPLDGIAAIENRLHCSAERLKELTAKGVNVGLPVVVETGMPAHIGQKCNPPRIEQRKANEQGKPMLELKKPE